MSKTDDILKRLEEIVESIKIERPFYLHHSNKELKGKLEHANHNLKRHLRSKGLLNSHWNSRRSRLYKEGLILLNEDFVFDNGTSYFSEEKIEIKMLLETQETLESKVADMEQIVTSICKELIASLESFREDIENLYNGIRDLNSSDDGEFRNLLVDEIKKDFKFTQERYNYVINHIKAIRGDF